MPVRLPPAPAAALLAAIAVLGLAACAPEPGTGPTAAPTSTASATDGPAAASPSPTAAAVALPTDCRAILSPDVLSQLAATPLNDPATGQTGGVQADGSLVCVWRHAGEGPRLVTEISRVASAAAADLLDGLATGGFGCSAQHGGTRCEKVWQDAENPTMSGRTLFWRDDVLIDTRWSNLAPKGYTDSIVAHLFPS